MSKSRNFKLRWGLLVAATLAFVALTAPAAAPAGTGGASSFTAPKPNAAQTSTGLYTFTRWRVGGASWYGPGLYGNGVACGGRLRPWTMGVAHKTLPCGTMVRFRHRGNVVLARVIDRGPYIAGRTWDLTEAAAVALDFEDVGVGPVRYSIAKSFARR